MTFKTPTKMSLAPPAEPARSRSRYLGPTALATSLLVHTAALVLLLGSASGDLVAGAAAGDGGGDMMVSLVGASRLPSAPPETAAGDLRPLLAKFANNQTPVELDKAHPAPDMSDLFSRLRANDPQAPETSQTAPGLLRQAPTDEPASDRQTRAAGAKGQDQSGGAARPGSAGGLWGKIEPCWRSLPGQSTVPVSLEVALDIHGDLTTPPKILRGRAPVDEPRLQAEARALSALAACMPRGDLRFSGKIYRLDFRPGG